MSEPQLLLFYHPESNASKKLMAIIPKDMKNLKLLNIDEISNLPNSITSVPTLVKDNKEFLTGKQVFDYFNKSDELECLNLGKGLNAYSNIDDTLSIDNNNSFSSIDAPGIEIGVPKWEEKDDKENSDIDKLQKQRENI